MPQDLDQQMTDFQLDNGQPNYQVCFITSKKRMLESQFLFGTYCEVSIEILRQIRLKYIEDYEGLVQFLADFHLIPKQNKPCLLCIDSLDFYVENNKSLNNLTRLMRLNFLMTLIQDCQQLLDSSSVFKANNTLVTYRCSSQEDNDFLRIYNEMSKYSNQLFYLCKNDSLQQVTYRLLHNCSDIKNSILGYDQTQNVIRENDFWQALKSIELFKVEENPYFFEEEFSYKVGVKRNHSTMVKNEGISDQIDVKLESSTAEKNGSFLSTGDKQSTVKRSGESNASTELGRPQSYKFTRLQIVDDHLIEELSISSLFNPILKELRVYLDDLSKQLEDQ
eukprot:403363160